jgi:hypothetical protein
MSITDVQRGEPCKRNCGWTTRNLGGVCRRCLNKEKHAAAAKAKAAAESLRR